MAKFYDVVGFAISKETAPDIWKDEIVEHSYYGDVQKNTRRWQGSETLNDNLEANLTVSIVADAFASENFQQIKYVRYMGSYWKVPLAEPQYPRIILTIGGVYNGDTAST